MSNPDSFIDEVTEEVRRDRLFRLFRKYGWIGVVIILGLVIGTAWTEWSKSRAEARAEAFGDAVIDALDHGTPDERAQWEWIGDNEGIHWPLLDEDISVEGIIAGRRSGESQKSLQRWLEARTTQ